MLAKQRHPENDVSTKDGQSIAVALEYAVGEMEAPRIVATGRGMLADQILQIAFDAGINVREDADLAQVLSAVELDTEIPVEAFAAVAEILAYVYHINGNTPSELLKPMGFGFPDTDDPDVPSNETNEAPIQ